jgi:hypothetical protein
MSFGSADDVKFVPIYKEGICQCANGVQCDDGKRVEAEEVAERLPVFVPVRTPVLASFVKCNEGRLRSIERAVELLP